MEGEGTTANDEPTVVEVDAVVAAGRLQPAVAGFRRLGFSLRMIMPADDPSVALLEGDGLAVRLRVDGVPWPTRPDVSRLRPAFELTRFAAAGWGEGRAGMQYRDLLPSRQGGRFIASHIRIVEAGPVADEVHFHHDVRFQLIACVAGWVRLVYEAQGEDFVLGPGDVVLQPPGIRHRVLESAAGTEVVELACPAVHETRFDTSMTLPTSRLDRRFGGQRFVLHRAADAAWATWRSVPFECRDTGITAATDGTVGARIVQAGGGAELASTAHDGELQFWFVLGGTARILLPGRADECLSRGDAVAVPAGVPYGLSIGSGGCELLEVTVPAQLEDPGRSDALTGTAGS